MNSGSSGFLPRVSLVEDIDEDVALSCRGRTGKYLMMTAINRLFFGYSWGFPGIAGGPSEKGKFPLM